MFGKQLRKFIVVALSIMGFIFWRLNAPAIAKRDEAQAEFITSVNPNLIAQGQSVPQLHLEAPEAALLGSG